MKKICLLIAFIILFAVITTASAEKLIEENQPYLIQNFGVAPWIDGYGDDLPIFAPVKHGVTIYNGVYLIMPLKAYMIFNSDKTVSWVYDYYWVRDTKTNAQLGYHQPNGKVFMKKTEEYKIDGEPVKWAISDAGDIHFLYLGLYNQETESGKVLMNFLLEQRNGFIYAEEIYTDGKYSFVKNR